MVVLQQQIQKRHGPIMNLKMCKGHFAEATEMAQDMDTLEDYGVEGAPDGEPEVVRRWFSACFQRSRATAASRARFCRTGLVGGR